MKRSLWKSRRSSSSSAPWALAALATTAGAVLLSRALRPSLIPSQPVVLITGGSRGLGLAMAHRFAREGAHFVLCARRREELEQAQAELLSSHPQLNAHGFYLVAADLSRGDECERLIAEAIRRFGRIDVLINNAAIMEVGPVEAMGIDAFERAVQVNLMATVRTTIAALPHLLSQAPSTGTHRASIVNIASIGGKFAVPHMLPYTTAKFGVVGFSEGLHAEVRFKGVRVTTVCPGLMRTGGEAHAKFVGDEAAEKQWFDFAATTPGIAVSAQYAADRIYDATRLGRAEITITPQAWLGARAAGIAPETLAYSNALVDRYALPDAPGE